MLPASALGLGYLKSGMEWKSMFLGLSLRAAEPLHGHIPIAFSAIPGNLTSQSFLIKLSMCFICIFFIVLKLKQISLAVWLSFSTSSAHPTFAQAQERPSSVATSLASNKFRVTCMHERFLDHQIVPHRAQWTHCPSSKSVAQHHQNPEPRVMRLQTGVISQQCCFHWLLCIDKYDITFVSSYASSPLGFNV